MSYNAKEIWIPCDTVENELPDDDESDEEAIECGGSDIERGLLYGVHGILQSTGGTVVVRVFNNEDKDRELYKTTLDYSGGVTQVSDVGLSIPMFETPYYTLESDATSGEKDFEVTFYVKALA